MLSCVQALVIDFCHWQQPHSFPYTFTTMTHPTQIFLHNPKALRVEFLFDESRLLLWWSPLAGVSNAAAFRNFSNRDDHLAVFQSITLPGCGKEDFLGCDYDPYHSILKWRHQTLHMLLRPDAPALLLWAEIPQLIDCKTHRYDVALETSASTLAVLHEEPAFRFHFIATAGEGAGVFRQSTVHAPWHSRYAQIQLGREQALVFAVGLENDGILESAKSLAQHSRAAHLAEIQAHLHPHEKAGEIIAPAYPEMMALRRTVVRGLHSMIDDSAAFRASLKAIYYLIWIRDAAFTLAGMTAAGWPHKLAELTALHLDNPLFPMPEETDQRRRFGQLIDSPYGKLEEDGWFYVVWTAFLHWVQTGEEVWFQGKYRILLEEALSWVEDHAWREESGLFEGYFADETPALGARDYAWDYAIGQPVGNDHIRHEKRSMVRSRDIYLNTLMHSAYRMMAAVLPSADAALYEEKASRLWKNLARFYADRDALGLPPYGELLDEAGIWHKIPHWGPATSIYVWALSLPNFLPLPERDALQGALLRELGKNPTMHWINGLSSAIAAADPWMHGETMQLDLLRRIVEESQKPGEFLPMGGAMPEKFAAPQGCLYHDIRPQGFAMGAWLGAWTSLGLRRLPFGLALRPTQAFAEIRSFQWRNTELDCIFGPQGRNIALEIDGKVIPETLQIPEDHIPPGRHTIRLVEAPPPVGLWLRSTVRLLAVNSTESDGAFHTQWKCEAFGLSEIAIEGAAATWALRDNAGNAIPVETRCEAGCTLLSFSHRGIATLARCPAA